MEDSPWNLNNNSMDNLLVDTKIYSYITNNLENAAVPYKIHEHLNKIINFQRLLLVCREPIQNFLSVRQCLCKTGLKLEKIYKIWYWKLLWGFVQSLNFIIGQATRTFQMKNPYTFLCLSLAYTRAITKIHKESKKIMLQPKHHISNRERYSPDFCCMASRKSVLLLLMCLNQLSVSCEDTEKAFIVDIL
jgi:hypothetical protein